MEAMPKQTQIIKRPWDELWASEQAEKVRTKVRHCDRQCWMIGSVSPAMHKYIWVPTLWVIKHKFLRFWKKDKEQSYGCLVLHQTKNSFFLHIRRQAQPSLQFQVHLCR